MFEQTWKELSGSSQNNLLKLEHFEKKRNLRSSSIGKLTTCRFKNQKEKLSLKRQCTMAYNILMELEILPGEIKTMSNNKAQKFLRNIFQNFIFGSDDIVDKFYT